MTFEELLDQAIALLQRRGRLTYRALKRQFNLDDDYLEDLKAELIQGQRLAVDEDGAVLVWSGNATSSPVPVVPPVPARAPLTYMPPHLIEQILTSKSALEGERKQVTVLFADLQGSMELLADRDPEEARRLLDPVLERLMAAVHRYEGTVNQVMGDGIMALFGAPIAHEDHAVRACYAALAMQEAVGHYSTALRRSQGLDVQIRVGLNSGEVVVRSIGNDLHMDYSAIGQTTHLAARMEQLARPGTTLLTADTLRLVEGLVRVQPMGLVPVKGLAEPVEVSELVGASAIQRRFQAAVARGLTRFVGRDHEMTTLQHALTQVRAGHGQVVAAVGEAGVGKSRLVYELIHSHHTQDWRVLESVSVSYGKATPYFPVIDLLRRYAHVEERDDPRTIRAKVTGQVLTLDESLQDTIPALLALLEVLPDDSPFHTLDPPQHRQRTLDALKRVLLRESQMQPLLLVFEDLHWIDSATQALLDSLVESLPTVRLLLLLNYRPEYQHSWGSKTYYTRLRLDPLPAVSAEEFLYALLGDDPSLEALKHLLITRTEGNPFFLEESVRTLIETGGLVGETGAYRLAQPLQSIQVPATVQAVLAARIDRLPPDEKRLVQTAAVIGMEVPLLLLEALIESPEEGLHRGLAHLQAAEFLYETHLFPEHAYTFKHALTHEVAYGGLLQERRRVLHARIVETLEALYPERLAEQVERLAHHAWRGEVWDKVLTYCQQAGVKASTRCVYRDALAQYDLALAAIERLPRTTDTLRQRLELMFQLRDALIPIGEYERVRAHLWEAERLATVLGDERQLGWISCNLANYCWLTAEHESGVALGQRALALATAVGDLTLRVAAKMRLTQIHHALGEYCEAIRLAHEILASLDESQMRERFGLPGPAAVWARAWLGLSLAETGEFAPAAGFAEEAMRIAESLEHPYSVVIGAGGLGLVWLLQGEVARALPLFEQAFAVCQAGDFPSVLSWVVAGLSSAHVLGGRAGHILPVLASAVEQTAAKKIFWSHSGAVIALAEECLQAGQVESALQHATQAVELSRHRGERACEAWALQLEARVYEQLGQLANAENAYNEAYARAQAGCMRPLQARCRLARGALYRRTGQYDAAQADLSVAGSLLRTLGMAFWLPQVDVELTALAEAQCTLSRKG